MTTKAQGLYGPQDSKWDPIVRDLEAWKADVIDWRDKCGLFAETHHCPRCGWNVGFVMPLGAALKIEELEAENAKLRAERGSRNG